MPKILITSGPTRQYLDPIRYLTNASSGRMGAALAQAALDAGFEVVVVSGPVDIKYPDGAQVVDVVSTEEMRTAAMQLYPECVGAIGAAAPCDYRPDAVLTDKMSKNDFIRSPEANGELLLRLRETPDIMASLGATKREFSTDPTASSGQWLVAFALETSDHHVRALQKLQRKHCDLIVVNDPTSINGTTSNVEILDATGETLAQISGDKTDVARRLIAEIQAFVAKQTAAPDAPADI
ncbi:MAG: phosphopantothenoylcysteine decarboxylase [Thermoguttaceae bacterium]|nr:phosphopantothenoylcysteine decarboxylase [Thermoguttaceae bacterium]